MLIFSVICADDSKNGEDDVFFVLFCLEKGLSEGVKTGLRCSQQHSVNRRVMKKWLYNHF